MKALNIGSNIHLIERFINCDIDTSLNQNIVYLNAEEHFDYPDNHFDYIYSCHLVEHLSYEGFKNYLSETYRCLKPSGIHRICFPSLNQIKKMINNPEEYNTYFVNILSHFGKNILEDFDLDNYMPYDTCINQLYKNFGHQNIYSEETFIKLCEKYGFKDIKLLDINISDYEIFNNIEKDANRYDFENFKIYESSVVECTK